MKNSASISLFNKWELEPAVANLITPTCFSIFRKMTDFRCNNNFLQRAIELLDDGKFVFGKCSLYLGLEDIYNITGLPVDGKPIVCRDFDSNQLIMEMLGEDDPSRKGNICYVRKSWLKDKFEKVPDEILRGNNEGLLRYARAYILFMMGTILFPDNQKTTVFVGYLLFLEDFTAQTINSFAWGTAVLAKLQAGFENFTCSKGAIWILEMFFLERIPLLRKKYLGVHDPKRTTSEEFPSCLYWSKEMQNVSANMHLKVKWKKLLARIQRKKDITWRPYKRFTNENQRIFYSCFVIFDIDIANFHRPQLSPRQLNIKEVDESAIKKFKHKTKSRKGHSEWRLLHKYKKAIEFWNDSRYNSIVKGKEEAFVLPPIPQPRREDSSLEQHEGDQDDALQRQMVDSTGDIQEDQGDGHQLEMMNVDGTESVIGDQDDALQRQMVDSTGDIQEDQDDGHQLEMMNEDGPESVIGGQVDLPVCPHEDEHVGLERRKRQKMDVTPLDIYLDRNGRASRNKKPIRFSPSSIRKRRTRKS